MKKLTVGQEKCLLQAARSMLSHENRGLYDKPLCPTNESWVPKVGTKLFYLTLAAAADKLHDSLYERAKARRRKP